MEKSKAEQIVAIGVQILRREIIDGHLKWKVVDIARAAKISRSRLYELLGSGKKKILLTCLNEVLGEVYGLSQERLELRKTLGPVDGILRSRKLVIENPELLAFYFRYRNRPDEVGNMIRDFEKRYLKLVSEQTGIKDPEKLMFIRTIVHGISVAPYLSETEVQRCLSLMLETAQLIAAKR